MFGTHGKSYWRYPPIILHAALSTRPSSLPSMTPASSRNSPPNFRMIRKRAISTTGTSSSKTTPAPLLKCINCGAAGVLAPHDRDLVS